MSLSFAYTHFVGVFILWLILYAMVYLLFTLRDLYLNNKSAGSAFCSLVSGKYNSYTC